MFKVLKLARQDDHKIKPLLVSIYLINAVRTVVTYDRYSNCVSKSMKLE